jgi:ABC-2 type transport system ATP-binding protein
MVTTDTIERRLTEVEVSEQIAARDRRPVAIAVDNVSKTYPAPSGLFRGGPRKSQVVALSNVSLNVRRGEIFGLIGRNGAGKTTLTKIIATLVQPTSGSVTVNGYDSVREEQQVRRQTGLSNAEERSFYWRLTVQENLIFFARLYGLNDRQARSRIGELLTQLELESSVRKRLGQLSTGNKQRMAVARALLNSPPVLLLDEPTRSLDPLAAARMCTLIAALAKGDPPVSILLTSHNLTEIEELCERVAIISGGQIRITDTPANIRAQHKQRERVRLTLSRISDGLAAQVRTEILADLEMVQEDGHSVLTFSREVGDDSLDRSVRALLEHGAHLLSCDVERPTLLEVLESYEREQPSEGKVQQ